MTSVLFEAWGRYADAPRAISELMRQSAPDLRRYWVTSTADGFPPGERLVQRHSPEYFLRIATTSYLFNTDIVARHYLPGPAVRYVQCWHGTPLKAIGFDDNKGGYSGSRSHARRTRRDLPHWDYLVSPSPVITPIFRSAFRFDGPVLEVGNPRNDLLLADHASVVRERVRARLGLRPEDVAVLYAPTWRDDDALADGTLRHSVAPDWTALASALPQARFLFRAHKNVVFVPPDVAAVTDVSACPDISELYLASDCLVSDYSSAIFDYAVTGKPIILYAPDLDHYRTRLRSLYFEYESWAPGPIVRTSDGLIDNLSDLASVASLYEPRYRVFQNTYCPYDDGKASERLLRALGLLG